VEQKWHGALSEIAEELSAKGRPLTQEEATEATGILNKLIGSGVFSEDEAIQISAKQFTNGARAGAEAERKAVVQRANGRAAANGAAGGSRSGITNAVKISDFLGKPGGMEKIEQYQKRGIL
jgi:hypothetical protein